MQLRAIPHDPAKLEVDALVTFLAPNQTLDAKRFGASFVTLVSEASKREQFGAKSEEFLLLSGKGTVGAYKILVCGVGNEKFTRLEDLYHILAFAVKKSKESNPAKIALVVPDEWIRNFDTADVFRAACEASLLSSYRFLKYKDTKDEIKSEIEEILFPVSPGKLNSAQQGIDEGQIASSATCFARDLVNEPPEVTTPEYLAQVAHTIAKDSKGAIKVTVLEREDAQKLGMGAFLAVSQGSPKPPKFIILRYKGKNPKKKVVVIGKGITFDTGGLSIKPAEHMETMKLDMAGAAAVLGAFKALTQLSPAIEIVGMIASCENMPSGKAIKPGDIVTAANGKHIEILNTDAEGRLTLADVISYAKAKEKPSHIIDLATLTGACVVALGQDIAGLFSNNDALLQAIEKSASETGELVWRLPLFSGYKKLIKSHIADIKNIQTGKYGGAITAALFLADFVGDTPWVHLDIAGPAYQENESPLMPKGGTGFGVRLLLRYFSSAENSS